MPPKPEDGTILMRAARPIEQGAEVDPKTAGVKLVGPSTWRDGSQVKLVWCALASIGRYLGHSSGPFEMTIDTFDEICRNFNARGLPLAFDYEHASEAENSSGSIPISGAPACGWIHSLVSRGPDGLWGLVEWLDGAREQIRSGAYAYVSPAIRFGCSDPVSGKKVGSRLSSAALVNAPFLSNLPQLIAASDKPAGSAHGHGQTRKMDLAIGDVHAPGTATRPHAHMLEAQTLPGIANCKLCCDRLMKMAAMDDDEGGDVEMRVAGVSLLLRDSQQTIAMRDQTIALKDTEISVLKAEIEKRDDADRTARVELAFATWRDQKKLGPADKEAMAYLCTSKRDVFERAFPIIEAEHAHLLRTVPPEARPRREGPISFSEAAEGSRR